MWHTVRRTVAVRSRLARRRHNQHLSRLEAWTGDIGLYPLLRTPWFRHLGIQTVIDVGANTGQFAKLCRFIMPNARIVAFEPLPDCFHQLTTVFAHDDKFEAHNMALGSATGNAQFNQNAFSPASSMLEMATPHKTAFPFTATTSAIEVRVLRLDDIIDPDHLTGPILLKMDVQGFESQVIAGGTRVLREASIVLVEVSFIPLYFQQTSFAQLHESLAAAGFTFAGGFNPLANPLDKQVISQDCLFVRSLQ